MNRRAFFGLLTGLAAAMGFKAKAKAEPETLVYPVEWGPGKLHPHWRVPQGRWTFVKD